MSKSTSEPSGRKIAFYSVATHLGGSERTLSTLIFRLNELSQGRYSSWVIVPKPDGPMVDLLKSQDIPYEVVPMPDELLRLSRKKLLQALLTGISSVQSVRGYVQRLHESIQKAGPVVIHSNSIKTHVFSALPPLGKDPPVLWHMHDILKTGPTAWLLRALFRRQGITMVANSWASARAFHPDHPKISVVYNGLMPVKRVEAGDPNLSPDLRALFGISREVPIIGILGVLARWKGQIEFLRMAKTLLDGGLNARFAVIGGEIYDTAGERGFSQTLQDEARRLGITDRVHFTGFLKNPIPALCQLDLLVHASIEPEPFGRVIVEAMSAGVPVIATSAGGVLEILEHEVSGLLVTPGSVDEMARATKRVLGDPALRARMISNARKRFEEKFSSEQYVKGMIRLYDALLDNRQEPPLHG